MRILLQSVVTAGSYLLLILKIEYYIYNLYKYIKRKYANY